MSLINQMLKDLEARRDDDGHSRPQVLRSGGSARLPWILAGLLGIAVVALATALWLRPAPDSGQATPMPAAAEAATAGKPVDTARTEAAAVPEPAETVAEPAGATADPGTTVAEEPKPVVADKQAAPVVATPEPVAPRPQPQAQASNDSEADPAAGDGSLSIEPSRLSPQQQAQSSMERGFVALRQRDFRGASDAFTAGLAILPAEDEAREALYQALRRQGRLAEAEGVLENGLLEAREPHRFGALLARMYAARGELDAAIALLQLSPPPVDSAPQYHALLGALLQQAGDYAGALPVYQALVKLDGSNGQWLAGLGIAQQQTGATEAAVDNYRAALDAGGLAATVEEYIRGQLQRLAGEED